MTGRSMAGNAVVELSPLVSKNHHARQAHRLSYIKSLQFIKNKQKPAEGN